MDGVAKALHEDPHMLDVADTGFLVNTGKQLILVDAGAGTWWGGAALGRLAGNLAAQATRRKKSTSSWSRTSIPITSRPDHSGRKARFSKCRCLRRQGRKRLLVVAGNRC